MSSQDPVEPSAGPARHDDDDHGHPHRRIEAPSQALAWSLAIVLGFGILEIVVGHLSGSLALVSDGIHMLTDALALAIAWGAQWIARREPVHGLSFGWARIEPLAAFSNAIFYVVVLVLIVKEAFQRIASPHPIDPALALPVAVVGLLINAVIWKLMHRDRHQINTRAALLHVMGDFAASAIAIVAISVVALTGWLLIDPLLSLAIAVLLALSTTRVIRDSARELLNAAPQGLDLHEVGQALDSIDGVEAHHDLHVWSIGFGQSALAAHLRLSEPQRWPQILEETRSMLRSRFGLHHSTLQAEEGSESRSGPAAGVDSALGLALRYERELDAQSAEVARALREDIGPQLTALRSVAASFDSRVAAREPSLAPLVSVLLRQTDELIGALRELIRRVRPDALSCGGLPEALRALAADWRLRCPGVRVELLLDPVDDASFGLGPVAIESAALQVASSVIEAAMAARPTDVVLAASIADGWLLVQIDHDGAGTPSDDWIASMVARFESLGGELRRDGSGARGRCVIGRLPWSAGAGRGSGTVGRPL